jgi:hypothetical protein
MPWRKKRSESEVYLLLGDLNEAKVAQRGGNKPAHCLIDDFSSESVKHIW